MAHPIQPNAERLAWSQRVVGGRVQRHWFGLRQSFACTGRQSVCVSSPSGFAASVCRPTPRQHGPAFGRDRQTSDANRCANRPCFPWSGRGGVLRGGLPTPTCHRIQLGQHGAAHGGELPRRLVFTGRCVAHLARARAWPRELGLQRRWLPWLAAKLGLWPEQGRTHPFGRGFVFGSARQRHWRERDQPRLCGDAAYRAKPIHHACAHHVG